MRGHTQQRVCDGYRIDKHMEVRPLYLNTRPPLLLGIIERIFIDVALPIRKGYESTRGIGPTGRHRKRLLVNGQGQRAKVDNKTGPYLRVWDHLNEVVKTIPVEHRPQSL